MKRIRQLLLAAAAMSGCATAPAAAPPAGPADRPEAPPPPPARELVRIGVVVSTTGSAVLQQYAEMVLDGARLAAEQQSGARRNVELVVRDDGGTAAGAAAAVRELEQAGVRVIVGPLVDEALTAAARDRGSEATLIISPTAVAASAARNVYALNVPDTRGAAALGEYARRYARVGVLYARSPDMTAQARAFMDAYSRGGHGNVRDAGFAPAATNVSAQLNQLRQARVEAIFFPASERHLQLVLPQVDYFGLGGAQLLGNEAWLSDAMRSIPARLMEGAVVATPLWRESPDLAWRDFVALYEARHRRTLDNPIPALGYDAVVLALNALGGAGAVRDFRGATGVLSLQPDGVTRRPFLVRLQAGRLVPVN